MVLNRVYVINQVQDYPVKERILSNEYFYY